MLWSEKIHLDSRKAVLIGVEQKSGFCRSMLRRGFESVVPCIRAFARYGDRTGPVVPCTEHSLGTGIEPPTSLIDDFAMA